ncbi:MAG: hypothetical protein LBL45_01830 [Treponema sp.]|nr:hypothetical protein [Treponema sp.]
MHGYRRELFGALAAMVVSGKVVKITKPDADTGVWQTSEGGANGRSLWGSPELDGAINVAFPHNIPASS